MMDVILIWIFQAWKKIFSLELICIDTEFLNEVAPQIFDVPNKLDFVLEI